MLVLFSSDHKRHNPKFEYYNGAKIPYAERPERIEKIVEACREMGLELKDLKGIRTNKFTDKIEVLHSKQYIEYLKQTSGQVKNKDHIIPSVFIKDTHTPLTESTYSVALESAELAVEAARRLKLNNSQSIYVLCRPPGHHAEEESMAGYCYFNNIALAANDLSIDGKVAILDIDFHHGNGTQKMFYRRDDVLYVSLHADPKAAFPYQSGFSDELGEAKGAGFNYNIPLPVDTTPKLYLKALNNAIDRINEYKPKYLLISLGFDTFVDDPIGGLGLTEKTYFKIGQILNEHLKYPTLIVQEGGYNIDKLGELAKNFVTGFENRYPS